MAMKTFCCRWNLRTGSLVCAIWTLIWCAYSVAVVMQAILSKTVSYAYDYNYYYADDILSTTLGFLEKDDHSVPIALHWTQGGIATATMLAAIILICGVIKNKAMLMLPWMLMVGLLTITNAISLVFSIMSEGLSKLVTGFLLIWIVTGLLNLYCEFCVYAHYKEVKSGRGRPEDYRSEVQYQVPAVQHVHITDGSVGYIQSQRTIYSVNSQTLYKNEELSASPPNLQPGRAPFSMGSGRIYELRPAPSVPGDTDSRINSNAYTGSIEMKMVDSMPVIIDRSRLIASYTGSMDMQPPMGRRSKRLRTVSESAANRRPLNDSPNNSSVGNSMKNLAVGRPNKQSKDTNRKPSTNTASTSRDRPTAGLAAGSAAGSAATTSFILGSSSRLAREPELSPLTDSGEEGA